MQHVKLIDYIDRPEMIRHITEGEVLEILHDPNAQPYYQMKVHFKAGGWTSYSPEGMYGRGETHSRFILNEGAMAQFEVGKKYCFRKSKGWAKCVAHVPEAKENYRVVFVTDAGYILTTTKTGNLWVNQTSDNYVIPVEYQEHRKFKYWVNVYPHGVGKGHASRRGADKNASSSSRIACVYIEGQEGDGLSLTIEEEKE
jgi:hypothetical protein